MVKERTDEEEDKDCLHLIDNSEFGTGKKYYRLDSGCNYGYCFKAITLIIMKRRVYIMSHYRIKKNISRPSML